MGCAVAQGLIPKLLRAPARYVGSTFTTSRRPKRPARRALFPDSSLWLRRVRISRFARSILRPQGLDTPRFGR